MIPRINDAFARPLYILNDNYDHHEIGFRSHHHQHPEIRNSADEDSEEGSFMDAASLPDTTEDDASMVTDSDQISSTSGTDISVD